MRAGFTSPTHPMNPYPTKTDIGGPGNGEPCLRRVSLAPQPDRDAAARATVREGNRSTLQPCDRLGRRRHRTVRPDRRGRGVARLCVMYNWCTLIQAFGAG